jgi:hypothetical protein
MNLRLRTCSLAALVVVGTVLLTPTLAAEKLKGFYSGSGGLSEEVHRVVLVNFGADHTAIVQQNWIGKDPQTWHAHWTQDGNKVTITFDPIKDKPAIQPLLLTIKHGTLIPTSWDLPALGVLGPPNLSPFGGKNVQTNSVAGCQSLNSLNPANNCVTWESGNK